MDKLQNIIENFDKLKVLVLGDVMLDVYDFCYSEHSRPSPEKTGRKVYQAERSLKTLGGAGNVAANLASLEVASVFISVCGMDGPYLTVRDLADQHKIHHFLIRESNRQTTTKTRLYIDDEYMLRRDDECTSAIRETSIENILQEAQRELKGTDIVIFSDYNKGFFSEQLAQTIRTECQERNIPIVVDFKPKNKHFFRGCDIVAPNQVEATDILPEFSVGPRLEEHIKHLYQILECKNVIVTLGAKGIAGFDGQNYFHIPGHIVSAKDAVGCGDTVRASLALGFASGLSLYETATLANFAGACVCQKIATAALQRYELRDFIKQRQPVHSLELSSQTA